MPYWARLGGVYVIHPLLGMCCCCLIPYLFITSYIYFLKEIFLVLDASLNGGVVCEDWTYAHIGPSLPFLFSF